LIVDHYQVAFVDDRGFILICMQLR